MTNANIRSKLRYWIWLLPGLMLMAIAQAQVEVEVYDTPGSHTFTVPAGVTEITVQVWGAGGRGGPRTGFGASGGGGGGAYASSVITVTPGQSLNLFVGAGSSGTSPGGNSWFLSSSTLRAQGGSSVPGNQQSGASGGSAAASVGTILFSGGNGADGSGAGIGQSGGGGGSSASGAGAGQPGNGSSGGTAPPGGGDGGNGHVGFNGDGSPGLAPGGGGGGATGFIFGNGSGGAGANGRVMITYEVAPEPPAALEGEWRMDEFEWDGSSGEILDSSGNDNHGTARTAGGAGSLPSPAPGKVCNAGRFRGEGFSIDEPPWWIQARHYADVPHDPSLSPLADVGGMSVGGWFRLESVDGVLLHKGEGGNTQEYRVFVDGSQLRFTLWNRWGGDSTMTVSPQSLSADTWYFFTVTAWRLPGSEDVRVRGYLYDENGQIGGVSEQILTVDYTDKVTSARLFLAAAHFGNNPVNFLDGLIDETRIHSGILDEAGIEAHWATTRPCPELQELMLEYRMEQPEWTSAPGEVLDHSGNDRHGTAIGDVDTAFDEPAIPGSPGTCRYASFEASSDFRSGGYILSPGLSELLNDTATMTFWIRTTQSSDYQEGWRSPGIAGIEQVGGTDDIFWGWLDPSGRIGISVGDDFAAEQRSTIPINDGSWRHIALTWDRISGDTQIYIDGALDQTGNTGTGNIIGNSFSSIGRIENTNAGVAPYYFDGDLDEVRIYEGVLSADDIAAIRDETRPCDIEDGPDHLRLNHPATGLTCSPATITVEVCADADCTSYFSDPVEVSLVSPAGNWTPNPALILEIGDVSLQYTSAEAVVLDAVATDPTADNPTRCFSGGVETSCEMEFLESGFLINVPDHIADLVVTGSIAAVKADPADPDQCVPGFDNVTRDIDFWSDYVNPAGGSLPVRIDGAPIAAAAPGTSRAISFDGNGIGSFELQYADVGDLSLSARYEGSGDEAGLIMLGEGSFITRPARFTLDIPGNPGATDEGGDVFIGAGIDFQITVSALNGSDALAPNFGNESVAEAVELELTLVAPAGGADPALLGDFGPFGLDCTGSSAAAGTACGEFSWPEVGIISLNPRLASGAYLGTEDVVGTAIDHIGRFIPDHFTSSGGTVLNRAGMAGCNSNFTYIGERFDVSFTLTARNAATTITQNYEGPFASLAGPDLNLSGSPAPQIIDASIGWMMGSGDASAQLRLPRNSLDGPFANYTIETSPADADGVTLLAPPDQVGATELAFGRLVVDNVIGSELGSVAMPWRAEYWDGSTWHIRDDDDCTVIDPAAQVALQSDAGGSGDGSGPISVGGGSSHMTGDSVLQLAGGQGTFVFSAPGSPGWIDLALLLGNTAATYPLPFLRDDLADDGVYDEDPSARASFGLFDGSPRRIFIQEIPPR
jgi:MSHA biogenesis protein MshQ